MAEILVVDSDRSDVDFYRKSLEAAGLDVTLTAHGQKALELLAGRDHAYVAVFLLWELSGSPSAPDLLASIRRHHPDMPVLVVNGQADLARLARAKAMGATAAALKPLTMDKLRAILASASASAADSATLA